MSTNPNSLNSDSFEWCPGWGPSPSAIETLRQRHPRAPLDLPGEAWFLSKQRKLFTEFLERPMESVSAEVIEKYLFEMTAGLQCFPGCTEAVEDWLSWFNYMLPFLVARAHEATPIDALLESVISTFIRVYPVKAAEPYSGFRQDALETVGKALMKPEFWDGNGELILRPGDDWLDCLERTKAEPSTSGALSASLFFCLLYLPLSQVQTWTKSLLAVESAYFRAHLLVWLTAVHQLLTERKYATGSLDRARFHIAWELSTLLHHDEITPPYASLTQMFATVRSTVSPKELQKWKGQFSKLPEVGELIIRFSICEYVEAEIIARR
jgi:hypothetical protein